MPSKQKPSTKKQAKDPLQFSTTAEIKVPAALIDNIIGQENAVRIVKKVAKQRRHLLLIGQPGVGKSLIGQALAELLPKEKLIDILAYDNPQDENVPIIKTTKKGLGQKIVQKAKLQSMSSLKNQNIIFFILVIIAMITPWYIRKQYGDILAAASLLASMMFLGIFIIFISVNKRIKSPIDRTSPKLLVDNATTETLFIDGTGAHSGALLGDCLHDPLQSGGLGTPPYERLIPGFIHRANGGVLFIDEVANLSRKSQQELLTALQEKRYPITGQSERSSGAMTRSQPVPCFLPGTGINLKTSRVKIDDLINNMMEKNKERIQEKEGIEILQLSPSESPKILVQNKSNQIKEEAIEAMHRRPYQGKIIRLIFNDGSELKATPEHPIKTPKGFVKAKDLTESMLVKAIKNDTLEEDIIKTYHKEKKRIATTYVKWLNSLEKLSCSELNIDPKTLSEWKKGITPHAIKSVHWLKEKNLIPLAYNNERTKILARIMGVLFGDGHINIRMNKVEFYTDINSLQDAEELKEDFKKVFGNIDSCFKIKKVKPRKGTGLILILYNAYIARFLHALGVPRGDKVRQILKIPEWIEKQQELKKEFYSSLLASELYAKLTNKNNTKDTASFSMAKIEEFEKSHKKFLERMQSFLEENNIKTLGIKKEKSYLKKRGRGGQKTANIFVLRISSAYENLENLAKLDMPYASYKKRELLKIVERGKPYLNQQECLARASEETKTLRKKGYTIMQIAEQLAVSKNTIWKWLPKSYNAYNEQHKRQVQDLLKNGKSPKDVSKQLNIPYPTIIYWKKHKIQNG